MGSAATPGEEEHGEAWGSLGTAPTSPPLTGFPWQRCCTPTPSCRVDAIGAGGAGGIPSSLLGLLPPADQLPPQCPSTLGEEQTYNPFLRTHQPELQEALGLWQGGGEDLDAFRARVLKEVRRRKDLYQAT